MNLDTAIIFTQSMQELADFYRQGLGYGGRDTTSPGHMGFRLENGVYLGFDQVETDYQVSGGIPLLWRLRPGCGGGVLCRGGNGGSLRPEGFAQWRRTRLVSGSRRQYLRTGRATVRGGQTLWEN